MPFNNMGKPLGYDQISPGRDLPKARTPLQAAVQGPPQQQMPTIPPQYPADPSLTSWRQRQPGAQGKIQPQVQPQQQTMNPAEMPQGDTNSIINQGFQLSAHRAPTDQDQAYWNGKWNELTARGQQLNDPNYAWKRLIGMGASGADSAQFGPYAGGDPSVAQHAQMNPLLSAVMSNQNSATGEVPFYKQLLAQLGQQT